METEFIAIRARLNHDFLKNRYLIFLAARQEILNDNKSILKRDNIARILEWCDAKEEFQNLLKRCEDALSPRQLLDQHPLINLPEEHKQWLGPLIHELFCARSGIRQKVTKLECKIEEINALVTSITNKHSGSGLGSKLYETCRQLSEGISELPSEIQVV